MIQNTSIDDSLNRLLEHFQARVVARPHATAADLAGLEQAVGPLPRDVTILYSTCNGLRLDIATDPIDQRIWSVHDIVTYLNSIAARELPDLMLPVRGDAQGELDCVFLGSEPMHGVVLRWDATARDVALLASSFGRYFHRWTTYVVTTFDAQGKPTAAEPARLFNAALAAADDPDLTALRARPDVQTWLGRLAQCVPCGDDFE